MKRHGGGNHQERKGNSYQRRARKHWLLNEFGDGTTCECIHGCGTILTYDNVEADRKIPGGSYRHENIQPSCTPCNKSRSNKLDWTPSLVLATA